MPLGASLVTAGAGLLASGSANKANKQAAATVANNYTQTRNDLSKYRTVGEGAAASLADPGASFQTSPGYDFRLKTGADGVAQNEAVNGLLNSGSALKALTDYNQNTASSEYGNWWQQQMGLANMGENAAAQTGNAGQAAAATQAGLINQNGVNTAGAITTGANALTGYLGGASNPDAGTVSSFTPAKIKAAVS